MRSESENKRYRDGYAAGRRDGNVEPGVDVESQRRSPTGDEETDAGYTAGFNEYHPVTRDGLMRQSADLFRHVPWLPQLSVWLKRVSGRPQ